MSNTLIIGRKLCSEILTQERVIPVMKDCLKSISRKETKVMQRMMIPHDNGNMLALMPASLISESVTGAKVIIFPGKETAKMGTQQGIIPLFDTNTGALKAIVDAELITVIRTAATSARATDVLARKDARTLAVVGIGKEGTEHINAISKVRNIDTVYIWNRSRDRAETAVKTLSEKHGDIKFVICNTPNEATENADIICTTTNGRMTEPLLSFDHIEKGAHINAVGTCSPNGREIDAKTVANSNIFCDWKEACERDAGDFIYSVNCGDLERMPDMTEIGCVISGTAPGRKSDNEITLFESVGISVEDIATAEMIYAYAKENKLGVSVEI